MARMFTEPDANTRDSLAEFESLSNLHNWRRDLQTTTNQLIKICYFVHCALQK